MVRVYSETNKEWVVRSSASSSSSSAQPQPSSDQYVPPKAKSKSKAAAKTRISPREVPVPEQYEDWYNDPENFVMSDEDIDVVTETAETSDESEWF